VSFSLHHNAQNKQCKICGFCNAVGKLLTSH